MANRACRRATVVVLGLTKDQKVHTAHNENETEEGCRNIPGECGCTHAEEMLLKNHNDIIALVISHSPCRMCARLIHEKGIKTVYYIKEYRKTEGIEYLKENNIRIEKLRW